MEEQEYGIDCKGNSWRKKALGHGKNLSCEKFDLLQPLFPVEKIDSRDPHTYWLCKCDCGNQIVYMSSYLTSQRQTKKSCGCALPRNNNWIDLKGKKFNYLTVLEEDIQFLSKRAYWKCLYDCGNITYVSGTNLRRGTTKSCGCLMKQTNSKNLLGQRFGKLTVIEKTDKRRNRSIIWKCQCDCGNIVEVCSLDLLGDTKHCTRSCGCTRSVGEEQIYKILMQNNIPFECEKTFMTCQLPESNKPLRFDFYVNEQFLLEFDGEQHFKYGNGWNTKEQYTVTHQRDLFKNQWCKDNNIPLKRIPYTELKNITLENIMDDTYVLKEGYYDR